MTPWARYLMFPLLLSSAVETSLAQQGRMEVRRAQDPTPAPAAKAVPATPSSAPSTASSADSNYRLRANDQLDVKVYQEADLSGRVQVREDGSVRLPLINETVRVGGLTVTEVENRIRALLAKDYVRDPRVSVNIAEYSKMTFTVMGEVNRAGTYPMPNNKSVSLIQAIGMAGSYTRLANKRKVYLKRIEGNQEKVYLIDAEQMARNANGTVYLKDGDVIEVKEAAF
jgi:protein involved in polysaccharide export with SLBB domain